MERDETRNEAVDPARLLRRQSRTAALWYLVMAITGPIGIMVIPSMLVVDGDAAATAVKIAGNQALWRVGVLSYLASQLVFIPLVLSFRSFLKEVNPGLTRAMVALVVASVPLAILNLVGYLAPLLLIGGRGYLMAFEPAQLQALTLLSIEIMRHGEILVGFFWGLWLLPLGLLVYRSGFFPKILGVFLVIGCAGYLIDGTTAILFPAFRPALTPFIGLTGIIGEIPFLLWLLIRGARSRKPSTAKEAII
ncbi:MAG: DUF4386 domain-containing protein [Treponemataceae bacterium]